MASKVAFSVPLRLAERKILTMIADFVALYSGLGVAVVVGAQLRPRILQSAQDLIAWHSGGSPLLWAALLAGIWLPVAAAFGAYEAEMISDARRSAIQSAKATLATLAIFVLIPYATPFLLSRAVIFALGGVTLALVVGTRVLLATLLGRSRFQLRTLIVGAGRAGRSLLEAIDDMPTTSYHVVGFIDDDPAKAGTTFGLPVGKRRSRRIVESKATSVQVLGDRHKIRDLVRQLRISILVLAITHKVEASLAQILMDCLEHGVEVIPMPVVFEQLTGRVPVEHVGDNWYVSMPVTHRTASPLYKLAKRVLDIVLSLLGMLILAPLLPLIAAAIYLDCPGPIFYSQERLGKEGRRFWLWKFRSMGVDAEKDGVQWASEDDRRVTRVGRILRKTHVDEFPQLWNILKGDMSAVGPRPERPEFVEDLEKIIPFYRTRLMVKPGMAGWALLKHGYADSEDDALLKLQYDLYYIKHQSFLLDLVILLRTIARSLSLGGR